MGTPTHAHLRNDPHVVCMQEVTAGFVATLMTSEWVRERYALSHGDVEGEEEYLVVMLVRRGHNVQSVAEYELPSKMGRTLLTTTLTVGNIPVTVCSAYVFLF